MNLLILAAELPYPPAHPEGARVFNLARELNRRHACHLAVFDDPVPTDGVPAGVFRSIRFLSRPQGRKYWRRWFRTSNDNYWELADHGYFRSTVDVLRDCVTRLGIDTVLATSVETAEFGRALREVGHVIDLYGSRTLAHKRQARERAALGFGWRRVAAWIDYLRVRRSESRLTRAADLVTVGSPVDRARLRSLNAFREDAIQILPNGVSGNLLHDFPEYPEEERTVGFWGAGENSPNEAGVKYFYNRVYVPYLSPQKIKWYIIGRNPSEFIRMLGQCDPNIEVVESTGNVVDLIRRIPILVNPVVTAGAVQSTLLDAFALRRFVISTSLGVEALDVESGLECIIVDTPGGFGKRIVYFLDKPWERRRIADHAHRLILESYTWEKVAERFERLLEQHLEPVPEAAMEPKWR